MPRPSLATVLSLSLLAAGCQAHNSPPQTAPAPEPAAGAQAPAQPTSLHFVTGPGVGPAIFIGPEPGSPSIGYISRGVEVEVYGPEQNGRVPVKIRGDIKVRAWLDSARLALRVQRRGRVRDTPAYVGPNDFVRVLGPAAEEGRMRIEVRPVLGRADQRPLGPYVGTFPSVGLSLGEVPETSETSPAAGVAHTLPVGVEVPLYDQPGGQVVATLPALTPPLLVSVVRDQGEWKGIRVGGGPYLVGYTNATLVHSAAARLSSLHGGSVPLRLQADSERPLFRMAAGTRMRFEGETVAIVSAVAYAREMNRYPESGEADVFVAVDDDLAIRGMVDIAALSAP